MNRSDAAEDWYYLNDGTPVGPFTTSVLKQLLDAGTITADTLAALGGNNNWQPLSELQLDEPAQNTTSHPIHEEDIVAQAKDAAKILKESGVAAAKAMGDAGKKAVDYTKANLPNQTEIIKENFWLFLQRSSATKAAKSVPSNREAKLLDSLEIDDKQQRALMIWRRSMLIVGMILMIASVIFRIPSYFEWIEGLSTSVLFVKIMFTFPILMLALAAFKSFRAHKAWTDIKVSRRYALHASFAIASQYILFAVFPIAKMNGLKGDAAITSGVTSALIFSIYFMPIMVGLTFGIMRGCLAARVFHPKNPIPGSMLFVASGLGFIIMILISGFIVQISGSFFVSISFLCILALVANNARAGYILKENIPPEKVIATASNVERLTPILGVFAGLFLIIGAWDILSEMKMDFFSVFQIIVSTMASFCILTIAFNDLVTLVLTGHEEKP